MSELTMSRLPLLAPLRPYVSFALDDKRYYKRLLAALRPLQSMGLLSRVESRDSIEPNQVLVRESERLIAQAHLLLLLLSISYFDCQHCRDCELVSARQRVAQSQLARLLPIKLLEISERVLEAHDIRHQDLLSGDVKSITDYRTQDRFWRKLIDRLFSIISPLRRNLDAELREAVYQVIIQAKRDTETLNSDELTSLRALDKEAWEIFMEVFLPVIRRAWADVKKVELDEPGEQPLAKDEVAFCCSVFHHLFLSPKLLICKYSSSRYRSLKHFIYYISVELLSEKNPT